MAVEASVGFRAANPDRLHVSSRQPLRQLQFLDSMQQRRPTGEVAARFSEDGRLRFLFADELAPGCSISSDPVAVEAAVRCVLTALESVLTPSGAQTRQTLRVARRVEVPGDEDLVVIHFSQTVSDALVFRGNGTIVFRRGLPISIHGTFFGDAELPTSRPVRDEVASESAALAALEGREIVGEEVFYDLAENRFFTRYTGVSVDAIGRFVDVDDQSGEILRSANLEDGYTPLTLFRSVVTPRVAPASQWDLAGGPTMNLPLLADRVAELCGGQCEICLDANMHAEEADPATGFTTSGDDAPVECASPVACSGTQGFTTASVNRSHFWMTDLAQFAKHWRAAYKDWYNWHDHQSENVKVVVPFFNPCGGGGACTVTGYIVSVPHEFRVVLPIVTGADTNLRTMAHEFGHVMARYYGYNTRSDDPLEEQIDEGWGDANVLRYAMYRHREAPSRPHDGGYVTQYTELPGGWDFRVKQTFDRGEARPKAYGGGSSNHMIYATSGTYPACSPSHGSLESYECGNLLSIVYWTLAWNQMRSGYSNVPAGTMLLQQGSYASQPERPANVAYTYAIFTIPDGGANAADFFDAVAARYYAFYVGTSGSAISSDDRHRVNQVLTSHCLGWSDYKCTTFHRTPGLGPDQELRPVIDTVRAKFGGPPSDKHIHFMRADDPPNNPPTTPPSIVNVGLAAQSWQPIDGSVDGKRYLEMRSGDRLELYLNFPVAGNYRVSAAVNAYNGCCDSMWAKLDSGPQVYWGFELPPTPLPPTAWDGLWRWSDGPTLNVASAGTHKVTLSHRENISIEAVTVMKVN